MKKVLLVLIAELKEEWKRFLEWLEWVVMMKKVLLVLVVLSIFLISSCAKKAEKEPIKIGFVLSTMQEERYYKDKEHFIKVAKELGAKVIFDSAGNDEKAQLAKVENILVRGVDVMVVQPVNSDTASTIVELCHESNVPVIAYDRIINNCELDFYVTQDSFKVGVLQAQAAVKATNYKGNYVICMGSSGHSVANEITRGNLSILGKYPDVKIVLRQNHPTWAPSEAMKTVENALTKYNNKIDAILCNNSGMARGAVEALREQALAGKVFVAGADADLSNCQYITQGLQTLDVLKGIKPLASSAVKIAYKVAKKDVVKYDTTYNNGKIEVKSVLTPVWAFTKENIDEVIIKSGFHSHEEVYGKSE